MRKAFEKLTHNIQSSSEASHAQQVPMHNAPPTALRKAVCPQPGRRPPGPGRLPPRVSTTTYHGPMTFHHPSGRPHAVARDLGFTGVLDGHLVWTWGDTLMGSGSQAFICATDSTSIADLARPTHATDTALAPGTSNVANWIPCLAHEDADGGLSCYAFGGTNIVEHAPNEGLVFFLKNHRPGGVGEIKGAGVATCRVTQPGDVPVATRACDTMWNASEPFWGDVGVAYDARDGHVYAFGKGPSCNEEASRRTYLCKVPAARALDVDAYSYWDEATRSWGRQRLANGEMGTAVLGNGQAVFGWMAMNQSAPFWSNWFNCWIFLYGDSWGYGDVKVMTAERLEGPWEAYAGTEVARGLPGGVVASTLPEGEGKGFRYCVTGHPEFDDSGRTVYVTWTRENVIYGTTVTWE